MKAIVIERQGAPVAANVRFVSDYPDRTPAPGELLIRTEASALNHLDLWVGMGLPGVELTYPRVSGSDGAGVVEAVGDGVDRAWVGERVLLNAACPLPEPAQPGVDPAPPDLLMIGEHVDGCLAERFVAPATNVVAIGDADPSMAAAFGLTHLTAWRMLVTQARLRAGQSVLITGIGGGVALALLAIAKHFGCRTIVTSRSQQKLDRAKSLGADETLLDAGQDWSRDVRRLTAKRGVDIVADSVGKAVHGPAIRSLARRGVFVTCGCTTGADATTDLARIFWGQLTVIGSTMGDMGEFRAVTALFRAGALVPVIDSVFSPSEASRAFARLEAAEQFGKLVIDWRRG
ncbi:MAG TPA: zinc-binding dehydrogenase [Phycisphaerales bacterium]|nr:zinc-binding dehydrogenase [Phycisphaerales bacterium]HMP38404.1 zinc-binding dehydrogenase [Phycisphaerales bacterium]